MGETSQQTPGSRSANVADARWRMRFGSLAGGVLSLGLLVSPFIVFDTDFRVFWVPWARATQGVAPWGAYDARADYPPLILYVLTLLEAIRRWVGAAVGGSFFLVTLKLPNLIAQVLCGVLADRGLRDVLGKRGSRIAAVLLVSSPVLFVNGALWGQYDVVLTLMILAIVMALAREMPATAGAICGVALMTKFQAVVAGPVLLVYLLRRFGVRQTLRAAAWGAVAMIVVVLPFVLAGAGMDIYKVFNQAVGRWPRLSEGAFNGWYLVAAYNEWVLHLPRELARSDARLVGGLISFKAVGLLLFASYILFLGLRVWQRPVFKVMLFAQVLSGLGFFMLPTQMHERYAVPAAALACVLVVCCRHTRWLLVWLTVSATLNQLLILYRMDYMGPAGWMIDRLTLGLAGALAVGNGIAFLLATVQFWHVSRRRRPVSFENAREAILDPSDELPEAPQAMP